MVVAEEAVVTGKAFIWRPPPTKSFVQLLDQRNQCEVLTMVMMATAGDGEE